MLGRGGTFNSDLGTLANQLSVGTAPISLPAAFDTITQLAISLTNVCVVGSGGDVLCWGVENGTGTNAGMGGVSIIGVAGSPSTVVVGISDATTLSMGVGTNCVARTSANNFQCWGYMGYGKTGYYAGGPAYVLTNYIGDAGTEMTDGTELQPIE
jgi:hypothetical protein